MNHQFTLSPDAKLLYEIGYIDEDQKQWLLFKRTIPIEIGSVWNYKQRALIDQQFSALIKEYDLAFYRDTLLFVALIESNKADQTFQNVHSTYEEKLRNQQLAKFLMLYSPGNKFKPNNLKVSSTIETVKVTSPELITWIGTLVEQFLTNGNFAVGEVGFDLLKFLDYEDGVFGKATLNYSAIETVSKTLIRKPGIRDRNRCLATFLLVLLDVLNNGAIMTAAPGVRFSDRQINFLFKVAEILGWIDTLLDIPMILTPLRQSKVTPLS